MCREFLVPQTTVHQQGSGPSIDCGAQGSALVTLGILEVEEQESLHVMLWNSADGADWGTKPIAQFNQKFYRGTHQIVIAPPCRWIQARWHVNRWGRASLTPCFTFYVFIEPLA